MYRPVTFVETTNDPLWEQVYADAAMSGFWAKLGKGFKAVAPVALAAYETKQTARLQKSKARAAAAAAQERARQAVALWPGEVAALTRQRTRINLAGFGSVSWQYVAAAAGVGLLLFLFMRRR